jgi:hypothetical protein
MHIEINYPVPFMHRIIQDLMQLFYVFVLDSRVSSSLDGGAYY